MELSGSVKTLPLVLGDRDKRVKFIVNTHSYMVDNESYTTTVTSYLDKFLFNEFDVDKVVMRARIPEDIEYELQRNSDDQRTALRATWSYARAMGEAVRAEIERFYSSLYKCVEPNRQIDEITGYDPRRLCDPRASSDVIKFIGEIHSKELLLIDVQTRFDSFLRAYDTFLNKYEICYPEYIVFDENRKLCGPINCVLWKDKVKREVIIVNWKTTKSVLKVASIFIRNPDSPFYGDKLSKMDICKCELHTYADILETNYNVSVAAMIIVHLTPDSYHIMDVEDYKLCKCMNVKVTVQQ